MAVNSILPPYPIFADASGEPLEGGYIYVGEPGFEARSTPKTSYFDKLLTVPTGTASGAAVRTTAGFPARNGSPAMIYADEDYSLTVTDKNGRVIYTTLNRTFAFGVEVADIAPILAPDGNFTNTGFGFINEQNTGRVRSSTGVVQDVVLGALVSQQSATGTVFTLPVSGAGFVAGVTAALNALLTAITALSANGFMARTSATTAAARTITAGAGVSVTNGNGVSGDPTIAALGLGIGQTWQDVTGSRAVLTVYQNLTTRPIAVNITEFFNSTAGNFAEVSADNVTFIKVGRTSGLANGMGVSFVVPVNHYYRLTQSAGATTFVTWSELR